MLMTEGESAPFKDILLDDEKVLWSRKPHHWAFIIPPFSLVAVGVLWGLFDAFFIGAFFFTGAAHGAGPAGWLMIPFFAFHLFPFWMLVGFPAYRYLVWKNTWYAITDKRFIIRSGIVGIDYKSIEFEQVSSIDVDVGLIARHYGVGEVKFSLQGGRTSSIQSTFSCVPDPYAVAKEAKQVSLDVKTDENYPNAMRPAKNPGYKTEYER